MNNIMHAGISDFITYPRSGLEISDQDPLRMAGYVESY